MNGNGIQVKWRQIRTAGSRKQNKAAQTLTYNARGMVIGTEDGCGNRLIREQYSNGSVDVTEGYRYNERNELTERVRAENLTTYSYDKNCSLVSEKEEGRKNECRYDLLNRQTYFWALDGKE